MKGSPADRQKESFAGSMRPLRSKLVPFVVVVALIFIPNCSLELAVRGQYAGGTLRYLVSAASWFSSWFYSDSLVILAVIAIARWWEKDPWSSLGISRPTLADPFLGVAAFLVYRDYLYTANSIIRDSIATNLSSFHSPHLPFPIAVRWLTSLAFSVLLEELGTRAYVIERVIDIRGNRWLAGLASVLVSLAIHLPGRTLGEMFHVIPIILLMTVLYIWRRNIVPGFIAHFVGNAVTTLILNPISQLVLWLVLPSRNWIVALPIAALYLALHYIFERSSRLRSD
jgi:membrane protease YdiL (CAAX protease family)